jgi:NitT/TauT family transport system ATP-binding protein
VPWPRRLKEPIGNDAANQVEMAALSLLHEEAMKSFAGGSKAAADLDDACSHRVGRS